MSDPGGLRARKKRRTRDAIERAALDLFEQNGFEGTTIDEIASAADIAPRTFFHYFPSKEDVVLADYTLRLDQVLDALGEEAGDRSPWSTLRRVLLQVAGDYEAERDKLLRRFRIVQAAPSVTARHLQLQAGWEGAVTGAVSSWLDVDPLTDVRPRLIAGAAMASMRASLHRWLTDDGSTHLPDHLEECFDLLGVGLGELADA